MSRRFAPLLVLVLLAGAALIAAAALWPRIAAAGWLIAFIYVSAIPLGSLALLLIHRLSGGHWGDTLRPFLEPAAACIPLLAILFVPVLIAMPSLFPWVTGSPQVKPDVEAFYLNSPFFIGRTVVAFLGWSALALALPRVGGKSGTLLAAVGLTFHAVIISLISIDWILSTEPVFVSTSFGASVAILQLLAALSFALVAAPLADERAVRDVAGLTLAVVLGLTYIDFMAVLVIWYGDLPHKVDWFVKRTLDPWKSLAIAGFVFGSVIPILALLFSRVRASRAALRLIGASILLGIAFYDSYLLAPTYDVWSLATAALALLVLGGALIALTRLGWPALLFERRRVAQEVTQEVAHE
jgi:hypothetical protein